MVEKMEGPFMMMMMMMMMTMMMMIMIIMDTGIIVRSQLRTKSSMDAASLKKHLISGKLAKNIPTSVTFAEH